MMDLWNFRVNVFGKVILCRCVSKYVVWCYPGRQQSRTQTGHYPWRDAIAEDLQDYFQYIPSKEWRFRISWLGKIILQREKKYIKMDDFPSYDSHTITVWEDATTQDMLDFYEAQNQRKETQC